MCLVFNQTEILLSVAKICAQVFDDTAFLPGGSGDETHATAHQTACAMTPTPSHGRTSALVVFTVTA
jgi:hypothetical protein